VSPRGAAMPSTVLLSSRPSARAVLICRGRACKTPIVVRVSSERFSVPGSMLGYAGAHSSRTSPNLAIHLIMFWKCRCSLSSAAPAPAIGARQRTHAARR
jgi:hypothetical protein